MNDTDYLKGLLSDVIGSGPKSAEDMSYEQAREAFGRILDLDVDPTTLGAFLLANRWKRNSPTELAAFVDVMRTKSVVCYEPSTNPVDCGANYDGKSKTAVIGIAAGLVAATAGTPIVVHSGDAVPTKRGVAYKHVLEALNISWDFTPKRSAAMVDEIGFGFYYQPRFNVAVNDLLDRREAMGVRTFINTIETLANPSNADVHVGSFYHLSFAKRIVDTVSESRTLDFDRIIMVQGLEGYDDIRPGYTQIAEFRDNTLTDFGIETEAFGMDFTEADLAVTDVARDSAVITEGVLAGTRDDAFTAATALNAALRLYAGGTVSDIDDGLALAREILDDGRAISLLDDLRAFESDPPQEPMR